MSCTREDEIMHGRFYGSGLSRVEIGGVELGDITKSFGIKQIELFVLVLGQPVLFDLAHRPVHMNCR